MDPLFLSDPPGVPPPGRDLLPEPWLIWWVPKQPPPGKGRGEGWVGGVWCLEVEGHSTTGGGWWLIQVLFIFENISPLYSCVLGWVPNSCGVVGGLGEEHEEHPQSNCSSHILSILLLLFFVLFCFVGYPSELVVILPRSFLCGIALDAVGGLVSG